MKQNAARNNCTWQVEDLLHYDGQILSRSRLLVFVAISVLCSAADQDAEKPTDAPPSEPKSPATAAPADNRTRVELNLLGKENAAAGESRRNENIQFNLVDNNALKELNVRLGATATIVEGFQPDRNYFGAEFGNPPSQPIHISGLEPRGVARQSLLQPSEQRVQREVVLPGGRRDAGAREPVRPGDRIQALARRIPVGCRRARRNFAGIVNGNVLVPMPDERTPLTTDPARRALVERFLAAYPTELPNRTDINPRALNTNARQTIDGDNASIRFEQDLSSRDRLLAGVPLHRPDGGRISTGGRAEPGHRHQVAHGAHSPGHGRGQLGTSPNFRRGSTALDRCCCPTRARSGR